MKSVLAVAAVAVSLAFAACTVNGADDDSDVVPETTSTVVTKATLIVDWSIDGSKDPALCGQKGAANIDIVVTTASGAVLGRFQQACTSFGTSITLDPGTYGATAALVDSAGTDRTTRAPIGAFTLQSRDEYTAPVDFSTASFF